MTDDDAGKKTIPGERLRAVALRYQTERDTAPRVVAKGSGLMAERIIEVARQHGVHIHQDPDLVTVLAKLDINTLIPESLYKAIAEILAFVYRINKQRL